MMSRLSELLFGKEKTTEQDLQPQYSAEIQNYLNDLENQSYMQGLLNQPKEKGLSLDQYKQGILQGLNYGVPEIAQAQQKLGINIPKTGEEISNAQLGQFNQYPMIKTGITNAPREGGLLNDLASGYRENYDNGFSFDNLAPNQNKGWTTRIGEGLGTVGRFLDSPLGRGLITAGLVGATGGSGLQALSYGLGAGVNRQNMQTADRVYRKQLGQMGYTDEDLNNITGNITPSIYKGLTDSFRLGNQRMTYGQLAMFDDDVAEMLRQSPELVNQFVPMQFARDIYGKRKDKAEADIKNTQARTEKTKAETGQVGKPRVTINRREGGTTSRVIMEHKGGSGKGGKTTSSSSNKTVRPLGQNLKEGTVIKNKQGQRMILRGGKWQPM